MTSLSRFARIALVAAVAVIAGLLGGTPVGAATSTAWGTFTNQSGTPISDAMIYFYASCSDYRADHPAGSLTTLSSGNYSVNVPDGTYIARLYPHNGYQSAYSWHPAKATCAEAQSFVVSGSTNVDLVARDGTYVSGSVSGAGPMTSGRLRFYASCSDFLTADDGGMAVVSGGTFTATLAAGDYLAKVEPEMGSGALASWHPGVVSCEDAKKVTIPGPLDLTAAPGDDVTGSVSSSNGPVYAGEVYFYVTCADAVAATWAARVPIVNGEYAVTVPGGTYRIQISPPGFSDARTSWHNAKSECAQADAVNVTGALDLDLVALSRSTVTGTVASPAGPVSNGRVYFHTSCGADYTASRSFKDGKYEINLPNGTYRVRIDPLGTTGAEDSWHNAKPACQQADLVTVKGDTALNLMAMMHTPTPPPPPPVTRVAQSVKAPPVRLKIGKSRKLAKTTKQGVSTTWTSLSKRACKVANYKVTAVRKIQCRIKVTAPETTTYLRLARIFLIGVK